MAGGSGSETIELFVSSLVLLAAEVLLLSVLVLALSPLAALLLSPLSVLVEQASDAPAPQHKFVPDDEKTHGEAREDTRTCHTELSRF